MSPCQSHSSINAEGQGLELRGPRLRREGHGSHALLPTGKQDVPWVRRVGLRVPGAWSTVPPSPTEVTQKLPTKVGRSLPSPSQQVFR